MLVKLAGIAGAGIAAAELLDQFLVAVDDARTTFDLRLAVKIPSGVCSSTQKLWS
jgi:hypothetical protein